MSQDLQYILYLAGVINESQYYDIIERSAAELASMPEPKDGKWISPNRYDFNVEGDPCLDAKGEPDETGVRRCYSVSIAGGEEGISVAFYRNGSVSDQNLGVGQDVFDGVRKALSEYITKNKPKVINWSPVMSSKFKNSREKAYEIWSIKALWPDLYVSPQVNQWIRRDVYDSKYVPLGYPPVPKNASKTMKSLQEFRNSNEGMTKVFNKLLFGTENSYDGIVYYKPIKKFIVVQEAEGGMAELYEIGTDGKFRSETVSKNQIRNVRLNFKPASTMQALELATSMMKAGIKEPLPWFPPELVSAYQSNVKRMAASGVRMAQAGQNALGNALYSPFDLMDKAAEKVIDKIKGPQPQRRRVRDDLETL